jgi:plastocyanin
MRRQTTMRLLGAMLGATILLSACGGGDGGTADDAGGDGGGGATSTVTMVDNAFEPSDPTVAAGDVQVVNDGAAVHTFTIDGQDVDVEVEPGGSATATVDLEPGSYTLFCRFHRSSGMETTITVE